MCDENQDTEMYLDVDYEAYERACEKRRTENDAYLDEFEAWLDAAGLSDKTISRHIRNVDFFLNTYLLREDAYSMEEGCGRMDDFLGYFFIRKCMWSTPETIRQNAASFKKFYKCMLEKGHIAQQSYDVLLADIKTGMPLWLEDCEEYNNPSESDYESLLGPGGKDLFDALYGGIARSLGLGDELGVGLEPPYGDSRDDFDDEYVDEEDLPTREEMIRELTLTLFYLTSQEEKCADRSVRRARKSADADALGWLRDMLLIDHVDEADSVTLTDDGMKLAELTLISLGLEHLVAAEDQEADDDKGTRKDLKLV